MPTSLIATATVFLALLVKPVLGGSDRAAAADINVLDPNCRRRESRFPASTRRWACSKPETPNGPPLRNSPTLSETDHPELAEPHAIMAAKLHLLGNQLGPARQELERAVVDDADSPEPYVLFGELALRDQRVTDAECLFTRAWRYSQAFKKNADRKKSTSIRSQAGLATVAELRGEWQPAIDTCDGLAGAGSTDAA